MTGEPFRFGKFEGCRPAEIGTADLYLVLAQRDWHDCDLAREELTRRREAAQIRRINAKRTIGTRGTV